MAYLEAFWCGALKAEPQASPAAQRRLLYHHCRFLCLSLTLFKGARFYPSDVLDITSQCWKQFISLGYVLPAKKIKSSPAAFPDLSLQTDKQSVQSWQPSSRSFTEVCTRPCLETRGGSELTPNSQFAVMCRGERQRDEQRRGGSG